MAKQEKTAAELYREERKQRIAKAAKKNQKQSHNIILSKKAKSGIAIAVVIAIVIGIAGFAVSNAGFFERGKVAMTVGEEEILKAEYSYYYNSAFSQYFNTSYQYDSYYGTGMGAMYTGYDWSKAPDAQSYASELEGYENPTWADFFDKSAKESIQYVVAAKLYAAENEITLDEEDYKKLDETMADYEKNAKSNNFSLPAFLRYNYGKSMSVETLRSIFEKQLVATKVQELTTQQYKDAITDKDVEKEYNKDLTVYGVVTLRNYVITAEKVKAEGSETSEVTAETLAAAKKKAEAFESKLSGVDSFKNVAYEYEVLAENDEAEKIKTDDSITLVEDISHSDLSYDASDEAFLKWVFNKDTAKGSTYIVEDKTTGYTVYMMVDPVHTAPDEETYDVRHILVKFPEDTTEKAEDNAEAETEEKVESIELIEFEDEIVDIHVDLEKDLKNAELYDKAQDILKEYLDGDRTEDAFAALAVKYSEDGNAAKGGIYEDVTKGYMVSEFENWALQDGRNNGDVGIVETTYGYHIMYQIGKGVTTWQDTIRTNMATAEYNEFVEEISTADNVKITNQVDEEVADVIDFTNKFAKTIIRNYNSSAAQQ